MLNKTEFFTLYKFINKLIKRFTKRGAKTLGFKYTLNFLRQRTRLQS